MRAFEGQIIGTCKSKVVVALNEGYLRELCLQKLATTIEGGIIYNNDLAMAVTRVSVNARKTLAHKRGRVPIYYDD
jgi:hypothetical protein